MDADTSVSSESSYSDSEDYERQNRWTGASSTWHALTEQERGLDASLVELRNRDLSIHLYNSFALKSSSREYSKSKDLDARAPSSHADRGVDEDDGATRDNEKRPGKEWAPPKAWTAWPLRPDQVPREGEHIGPEDEDELFTFKKRDRERPSRQLEELLAGTALKFAKKTWDAREMASVDEDLENESGNEMDVVNAAGETDGQDGAILPDDNSSFESPDEPALKESSEPPKERTILQPVPSADDERSRELLQPSIRHTLSRLDSVLMALHHARQTCRQFGSDSESSTDDERDGMEIPRDRSVATKRSQKDEVLPSGEVTGGDSPPPVKRPVGRPRKFKNLTSRPKPDDDTGPETDNTNAPVRAKVKRLGRPMKHYEVLEGETQDEYLIRIARLQKKPLPKLPSRAATPEPEPEMEPGIPLKRSKGKRIRLDTRDWSEVLGSAALVGFPPDVIARTAQRCADLFEESMTLRELVEDPAGAGHDDFLTTFKPEEIPELGDELQSSSQDSDEEDTDMEHAAGLKPRTDAISQNKAPCPFENCVRHIRGFTVQSNLKRHLMGVHKMTKAEIDEILDGTKEKHGGVHVDGFLKPIKIPTGMRGTDKRQRNDGRWAKEPATAGEESSAEKMDEDGQDASSED